LATLAVGVALVAPRSDAASVRGLADLRAKPAAALPGFLRDVHPAEAALLADGADGQLDEHSLVEAALVASRVDDAATRARYSRQFDAWLGELRRSASDWADDRQRAEAVFDFLHQRILRGTYHADRTDLTHVFECGDYNCLSSTVLFTCLARPLGLNVTAVEAPNHVASRLMANGRSYDIETTCAAWFRAGGKSPWTAHREVTDAGLVAIIYYNRGVDLAERQALAQACEANWKAWRLDPESATIRSNFLASLNNRALELSREHRFAESVQVLRFGQTLAPTYDKFALNFVAIHQQWLDDLCHAGRFDEASQLANRVCHERHDDREFEVARCNVYRRWGLSLVSQGRSAEAMDLLSQARREFPERRELAEAEVAVVNSAALKLLDAGRFEDAIACFERGPMGDADELLKQNRQVAVMRWADEAFRRGDYAEAIRRTTYHAEPQSLDARLANNVRYGYYRWINELRDAGREADALSVVRRAAADPFCGEAL
jgi:tetratricopeptide (TPR) repeat protein